MGPAIRSLARREVLEEGGSVTWDPWDLYTGVLGEFAEAQRMGHRRRRYRWPFWIAQKRGAKITGAVRTLRLMYAASLGVTRRRGLSSHERRALRVKRRAA